MAKYFKSSKIIETGIYDHRLMFIDSNDCEKIIKKTNCSQIEHVFGLTINTSIKIKNKWEWIIYVVLNRREGANIETLAHELIHAKNAIFHNIDEKEKVTQETEAYLFEWLFKMANKFYKF